MTETSKLTRRQALARGAALAAGALAVPAIAPRGLIAAAGRPGANDSIGIGYIGCGRRSGNFLLKNLSADAKIVAAADCYLPRAESKVKQFKGKAYQDYRKLLEQKDVDAVIVASPDHWHALHTIHACQAGKDVYVEKPMCLTIREGRLMVQAARRHGRIVQCGSQQRSMAANRRACELIRNGLIGKVHTVIGFNYPSPWYSDFPGQPVPAGLDWDMWSGQAEVVPFHKDIYAPRTSPGWISFHQYSCGEMGGWGAHGLDQIQWALGVDDSGPVEIWTEGGKFEPPTYAKPESRARGEKICSQPKVFFKYSSGAVVKLENGPHGGAIFIGDKGKISIDRGRFTCEPKSIAAEAPEKLPVQLYKSDNHTQNWFDCIKSRELPAADVEIGHRSSTFCHLGNIARWLGRKAKWDPKKEVFPGDKQANAFIDRERRAKYDMPRIA